MKASKMASSDLGFFFGVDTESSRLRLLSVLLSRVLNFASQAFLIALVRLSFATLLQI
jgi:hypothetical protein